MNLSLIEVMPDTKILKAAAIRKKGKNLQKVFSQKQFAIYNSTSDTLKKAGKKIEIHGYKCRRLWVSRDHD